MKSMLRAGLCVLLGMLGAGEGVAAISLPRIEGTTMRTLSAATGLDGALGHLKQQPGPLWAGYSVPMVEGGRRMCCLHRYPGHEATGCCSECRLEDHDSFTFDGDRDDPVSLEAGNDLLVLFRIERGEIGKLRTFSSECRLDAGGLPFYWLTGVTPAESLGWLEGLVDGDLRQEGIAAIAFHRDPEADRILETLISSRLPASSRGQAAFWMGAARGERGFEVLRRRSRREEDPRMREKIATGLAQSPAPGATGELIHMAREDESPGVRSQALFWLAQKAGRRAAAVITDAIRNDPETEVKKQAVFALSQLPREESVVLLIDLARHHSNPAVRRAAFFWLGQSGDPRALDFIEEVLAS